MICQGSKEPKNRKNLFLQLKRGLYADDLSRESFVDLKSFLYTRAGMDDGRVVTVTDELADTTCRHLRVFLSQIHRHLTSLHILTLATLTEDVTLLNSKMPTNLLEDIIYCQRVIVYLHSTLNDTLSQTKVYIRVIYNRISHQ